MFLRAESAMIIFNKTWAWEASRQKIFVLPLRIPYLAPIISPSKYPFLGSWNILLLFHELLVNRLKHTNYIVTEACYLNNVYIRPMVLLGISRFHSLLLFHLYFFCILKPVFFFHWNLSLMWIKTALQFTEICFSRISS